MSSPLQYSKLHSSKIAVNQIDRLKCRQVVFEGNGRTPMRERVQRNRPKPWLEYKQGLSPFWAIGFYKVEWWLAWASWALGHWAFLEVLEHLSTFSVLIAVIFYFSESGDRIKQKHYQAWQVINTAQGQGGSGGRIEALQELNADHVSLIGVNAGQAFLQGIHLQNAELSRCDLHASDLRNSDLKHAKMAFCNLQSANLRRADLTGADLGNAEMQDVDLNGAKLLDTNFSHADLSRADLRSADARNVNWKEIESMNLANIFGIQNASSEFLKFASSHGAVSLPSDEEWNALLKKSGS